MSLNEIQNSQLVIIDANIFIYANQRASLQCVDLIEKCAKGEISGVLPVHILAEIVHILMLSEARELGFIKSNNPAKQLSENPEKIKYLKKYKIVIKDLLSIGLRLESLLREDFLTAMRIQSEYGLLTNDALFIAVAERLSISSVVSADKCFKNISNVQLFSPDDIAS